VEHEVALMGRFRSSTGRIGRWVKSNPVQSAVVVLVLAGAGATAAISASPTASYSGCGYGYAGTTSTYAFGYGQCTSSPTTSPTPIAPTAPSGAQGASSGTSTSSTGTASATTTDSTIGVTTSVSASGEGGVTVSYFSKDPDATAPSFSVPTTDNAYFDVRVSTSNSFTSLTVTECGPGLAPQVDWYDATTGTWQPISATVSTGASSGSSTCLSFTLTSSTSPSISQLTGTQFAAPQNTTVTTPPPSPTPTPTSTNGYWEVTSGGDVYSFGDAPFHGSTGNIHLNKPIVGMAVDPATGGYWLVAQDGGIFAFDAPFEGSLPGLPASVQPGLPVVAMAGSTS
jgi:hypothetical protein